MKKDGRKYLDFSGRKVIVTPCCAFQISVCAEWTDERHGFYFQTIRYDPWSKTTLIQYAFSSQVPIRPSEREGSYLEEKKKTKNVTDTTSCRVRHSRKTKASPPSIVCPILKVQDNSVITMVCDWELSHSITERNPIEILMSDKGEISRSNSRLGKWRRTKLLTYWATSYLLWWPQQNSLTRSEASCKWGRWEQRLCRSQRWRAGANSTWESTFAQT